MIKIDLTEDFKLPDEWPEVFNYREDINYLKNELGGIREFKKLILIGNGGSITSYDAYHDALGSKVPSFTVWTMEPDYLKKIKRECLKDETVVVAVSKSGNTLGVIEALMNFADYTVIAVTDPSNGTLSEIAKKMNWQIIPHPNVGGRFSGGTSAAFVPALLAGMDIEEIQGGIIESYEKNRKLAYNLSKYYFDLEKDGYNEIFIPIYSSRLEGIQNLIIQLMHESVCKNGHGQTFYAALSPESQHHTNQRFFGGKKNVAGLFITVSKTSEDFEITVPENIEEIDYKSTPLRILKQLRYAQALRAEYLGTKKDADEKNIPNATIEIDEITPRSMGEFVGFWHMVAFYSSLLRSVNPFDQPAVERSKDITLEVIRNK